MCALSVSRPDVPSRNATSPARRPASRGRSCASRGGKFLVGDGVRLQSFFARLGALIALSLGFGADILQNYDVFRALVFIARGEQVLGRSFRARLRELPALYRRVRVASRRSPNARPRSPTRQRPPPTQSRPPHDARHPPRDTPRRSFARSPRCSP